MPLEGSKLSKFGGKFFEQFSQKSLRFFAAELRNTWWLCVNPINISGYAFCPDGTRNRKSAQNALRTCQESNAKALSSRLSFFSSFDNSGSNIRVDERERNAHERDKT